MCSNYIPLWYPLISIVFSIVSSININHPTRATCKVTDEG